MWISKTYLNVFQVDHGSFLKLSKDMNITIWTNRVKFVWTLKRKGFLPVLWDKVSGTNIHVWLKAHRNRERTKPPYLHTGWSATEAEYIWRVTKLQQPSSLVAWQARAASVVVVLRLSNFIMSCSVCEVRSFWPLPLQLPLQCNQVVPDPLNCHWQMRGGGIRWDRRLCTGTVTDCPLKHTEAAVRFSDKLCHWVIDVEVFAASVTPITQLIVADIVCMDTIILKF